MTFLFGENRHFHVGVDIHSDLRVLRWRLDNLAAERQTNQAFRRRELKEWQAERIVVMDAETIPVKPRDTGVEIKGHLC